MPYSAAHKEATRARIVESARRLFNRKGLSEVSIDEIMGQAGLTRGGFYNHFASKDELYAEAVMAYGKCNPTDHWKDVELDFGAPGPVLVRQMINAYLSREHLEDTERQCPMVALPSDIARASAEVKEAYQGLVQAMAGLFESGSNKLDPQERRRQALSLVALCVGSMVLARTLQDQDLANEIRDAARLFALETTGNTVPANPRRPLRRG